MSSQQPSSRSSENDDSRSIQSLVASTLRHALLDRQLSAGGDATLRRSIRTLADDARRRGLRAEQLVVAIREVWRALPETRAITPPSRGVETAARVISVCIDEFYAGAREDGDGRARVASEHGE